MYKLLHLNLKQKCTNILKFLSTRSKILPVFLATLFLSCPLMLT